MVSNSKFIYNKAYRNFDWLKLDEPIALESAKFGRKITVCAFVLIHRPASYVHLCAVDKDFGLYDVDETFSNDELKDVVEKVKKF